MILHNISARETCYDILNVKEDASYEEIRSSYRSLLVTCHPDKSPNSSNIQNPNGESGEDKFLKIQKAWEILNSSRSRALYDTKLKADRTASMVVADDINPDNMIVEEEQGNGEALELYYQCRCGDYFSVNSLELEDMGYKLSTDEQCDVSVRTPDGLPVVSDSDR